MIHGFYWSVFCSSLNFATVFFLSKHFSNSQIGVVLAAASICSVLLQPAAASFADRSEKISMKQLILVLAGAAGMLAALRFALSKYSAFLAVLFVLEQTMIYALQPLVNSIGVKVMNRGGEINFGLSRGIGSMSYAVVSILLGILVKHTGTGVLPIVSIVFYLAFGAAVFRFPENRPADSRDVGVLPDSSGKTVCERSEGEGGRRSLLVRNGRFILLLAAVSFTFCSHSMLNNFLIQIMERVGGTAENMGIASGIAAAIELPAMALFSLLIKKIHSGAILRFSFVFFLLKALLMLLSINVGMLYATQILQFGSYAMFIPASIYYVNEIVPKENLAKGQALLTSASTLGGVAANLLGGWLLDCSGVGTMLLVSLLAAAAGCAIGFCAVKKGGGKSEGA